ncbi:MAG: hypothetical protein NTX52_10350 [Planctomycetota bacterium]|nr:hypothetical protein [Planctomycetota bacterium]
MKVKGVVFAVLAAFFAPAMNSTWAVVDTRGIDVVRNKTVLDNRDLFIIDNYLAEAVREIVRTRDFTSVAKLRSDIITRQGTQPQYAEQYSNSAQKYISSGLEEALKLPEERRTKVVANLLILVDGLGDLRLADMAIARLKNKNTLICYWAVHCITSEGIVKQLNAGGTANVKIARLFVERLKELVDGSSPEIIGLIAKFAGDINIPQGEELLLQITDMRIKKYAGWTVEYELLDEAILKLLDSKMASGSGGSVKSAVRFGQLYSFAIQRYVKGRELLIATQKRQLASVLVETEDKCVGRILGRPQSTIKKAVERDDFTAIVEEHNRLLGDGTRAGELSSKLNFDYGTASGGGKRTAPLPLPGPPPKKTTPTK